MTTISKKTSKSGPPVVAGPVAPEVLKITYAKEYWTGDSRDGVLVNGDGYHFYQMKGPGLIVEAYEMYETDDGQEIASPLPEMKNVDWIGDLGFAEGEALEPLSEDEFERVRSLALKS